MPEEKYGGRLWILIRVRKIFKGNIRLEGRYEQDFALKCPFDQIRPLNRDKIAGTDVGIPSGADTDPVMVDDEKPDT